MNKALFSIVLAALVPNMALALLRAYSVEPVKAEWSGWTRRNDTVAQIITCNFDSLKYVELFAGNIGAGGQYRVEVWEDGNEIMWSTGSQNRDHSWVRFENWSTQVAFTKGKQYEFRFTRSGVDSIQFYYDKTDPYPYGEFIPGNSNFPDDTVMPVITDLCMRVYGRMNMIDSTYWGILVRAEDTIKAHNHNVHEKADSAGVRMDRLDLPWDWVWSDSQSSFNFASLDSIVKYSHNTMHCRIIGILDYCAPWASTRYDFSTGCPPRNLFLDVWHPSNYWARYVERVVRHYYETLGFIDIYEIWNEPNDTARFWKPPEFHYTISQDRVRGLCSLYARLCEVAGTVIDSITNGQATVLIGSLAAMQGSVHTRIAPEEMLNCCYRLANKDLWDGVSIHPYQDYGFNPDLFEKQAETLRGVMRANGDYGKLWITEIGWSSLNGSGAEKQAKWLCEAFITAKGSEARPSGGYDRMLYYCFLDDGGKRGYEGGFGLIDTLYQPKPGFYASGQTSHLIVGKRLNSRVLLGNGQDDSVRIYEFEEPITQRRTWVAWRNQIDSSEPPPLTAKIPVRSDTFIQIMLAYNNNPPNHIKPAKTDGWVEVNLTSRPVFLSELTNPLRPDLKVESTAVFPKEPMVGQPMWLSVWIKNIGNRATPQGLPTKVVFTWNSDSFAQVVYDPVIQPDEVVCINYFIPSLLAEMRGPCLITTVVNPEQKYVELTGLDDNRGYKRVEVR